MSRSGSLALMLALGLASGVGAQTAAPAAGATTAPPAPATQLPAAASGMPGVMPPGTPAPGLIQPPQPAAPAATQQPQQNIPVPQPVFPSYSNNMAMPTQGNPPPQAPSTVAPVGTIAVPSGPQPIRVGAPAVVIPPGTPPPASAESPAGTYKLQSISGERLYLSNGLRVRLAGVTFPPGQAGNATRKAVRELIRTLFLRVEREAGAPPLADQKTRVWMWLPDNRNVAVELLRQGLVKLNRQAQFRSPAERDIFIAAESYARSNRLGIWAR